jgi:hypothetical protein
MEWNGEVCYNYEFIINFKLNSYLKCIFATLMNFIYEVINR